MEDHNGIILILLVTTFIVASSKHLPLNEELSQKALKEIQQVIKRPKDFTSHEKLYWHGNNDEPHDHPKIQTLNLIFKHNNIGTGGFKPRGSQNKPLDNFFYTGNLHNDHIGRCRCQNPLSRNSCRCDNNENTREENVSGETILTGASVLNNPIKGFDPTNNNPKSNTAITDTNHNALLTDLENLLHSMKTLPESNYLNGHMLQCNRNTCKIIKYDDSNESGDEADSSSEEVRKVLDDIGDSLIRSSEDKNLKCGGIRCGCDKSGRCSCGRVNERCELDDGNDMTSRDDTAVLGKKRAQTYPTQPMANFHKMDNNFMIDNSRPNDLLKLLW